MRTLDRPRDLVAVSELDVKAQIRAEVLVDQRRARSERRCRLDHRHKRFVVHVHRFRRIDGLACTCRDDRRHDLTHVPDPSPAIGERRKGLARCFVHRASVARVDLPDARKLPESGRRPVIAREHAQNAWHSGC